MQASKNPKPEFRKKTSALPKTGKALAGHDAKPFADKRASSLAQIQLQSIIDKGRKNPLPDALKKGPVAQLKFSGATYNSANKVNASYTQHSFSFGGKKGSTGCGIKNTIITNGSKLSKGGSNPGEPTNMADYRDGFSTLTKKRKTISGAGLVRDKTLPQAATKMHIINHHLEDSNNTQGNPNNIFLGTQRSNKAHSSEVEEPVKHSVKKSSKTLAYEAALQSAAEASLGSKNGLFWTTGNLPANTIINHSNTIANLWYDPSAKTVNLNKQNVTNEVQGTFLEEPNHPDPGKAFRHPWLKYEVSANYNGRPNYVNTNITRETNWDQTSNNNKKQSEIQKFTNTWANDAFPTDFTSTAEYYHASFDKNNPYHMQTENQTIAADM